VDGSRARRAFACVVLASAIRGPRASAVRASVNGVRNHRGLGLAIAGAVRAGINGIRHRPGIGLAIVGAILATLSNLMRSKSRVRNAVDYGDGAVLARNSKGSRVELDCVRLRLDIRLLGSNGRVRSVGDECDVAVPAGNSIGNRVDLDSLSLQNDIGRLDVRGRVGTRVWSLKSDGSCVRNKGSLDKSCGVVRTGNPQSPGAGVGLGLGYDCRQWNRGGGTDQRRSGVRNKGSLDKGSSVVRTGNSQRPGVDLGLGLGNDCRQWNRGSGSDQRSADDSSGAIPEGDSPGQRVTGRSDKVRNLDSSSAIVLGHRLGFDGSNRLIDRSGDEVRDLDGLGAVVLGDGLGFDRSDRPVDGSGGEVWDLDGPGDVVPNHRLRFDRSNRPVDSNRRWVVGDSNGAVTQVHDLCGDDGVGFCRRIASIDQSVARRSDGGAVLVWCNIGLRNRQDAAGRSKSG
jgi:hypothetical protein